MVSLLEQRGLNPEEHLIEVTPKNGQHTIRAEDLIALINDTGDSLAMALLPGVQYYTGQAFEIGKISAVAKENGSVIGWDLAHAVGEEISILCSVSFGILIS